MIISGFRFQGDDIHYIFSAGLLSDIKHQYLGFFNLYYFFN
jgi:hypothetical protein